MAGVKFKMKPPKIFKNRAFLFRPTRLLVLLNILATASLIWADASGCGTVNDKGPLSSCNLASNLSYAVFSSTIFYFVVVYFPREKRKSYSYRFINNRIATVNSYLNNMLDLAISQSDMPPRKRGEIPDRDTMHRVCKKIPPNYVRSLMPPFQGNWFDFSTKVATECQKEINSTLQFADLMGDQLAGTLMELQDVLSSHLTFNFRVANGDISAISMALVEALSLSNESIKYFRDEFHLYQPQHSARYLARNRS